MQVFHSIEEAAPLMVGGSAVTIGNYDGIHRAHQAIIAELSRQAKERGLKSVLVTFDPHPSLTIMPEKAPQLLTTTAEKIRLLEEGGLLDAVVVLRFDKSLAQVSATDFLVRYLLAGLTMSILVIGFNHAFGNKREGNIQFLERESRQHSFHLQSLAPVLVEGEMVNSSRIRGLLAEGAFGQALNLLGHDLELAGEVVYGKGLGRKLGFPTINVKLPPEKIVPRPGVYAAYSLIGSDRRAGMMYIGEASHPGFDLEVNLFDFEGDLYSQTVSVFPISFVRPPIRFSRDIDLIEQIGKDEEMIRMICNIG